MPAKDVIDLQLTVPDLADGGRVGASRWPRPGFRGLTGSSRTPRIRPDDDPARWREAAAHQRRPGPKSQPPREGEGFAGLALGVAVPGLADRADPAVAAEYLAVKRSAVARMPATRPPTGTRSAEGAVARAVYPRGLAWARATGWTPAG